jgi:hypothetical protein
MESRQSGAKPEWSGPLMANRVVGCVQDSSAMGVSAIAGCRHRWEEGHSTVARRSAHYRSGPGGRPNELRQLQASLNHRGACDAVK